MKKMNRAVFLVLIILTALAGVTCKPYVGLGGQIDILPPSGEITYPDAGETPIRGSFILRGTAKDDDGIQSISVVFENIETKERSSAYRAEGFSKGDVSASWTIHVNNESTGTEPGHDLVKVYPIPDGEYTAIVSVTDKGGKVSTFTKTYKIDNTPPVFIVSRPSTIIINDDSTAQADPYGSVFTVIGQAEDRSKIEDLTLKVDGTNISVSKKFVGKNINEEIATATKNASDFTDPLYKYNADHASPKIKAHISLTDNARFFKGDGNQGEGNTSEWYYLRDRDIKSVLEKGYTADVINDYFAGKKGSASSSNKTLKLLAKLYDDNDPEGQSVKQILENARIMTKVDPDVQKFSFFTLDPNKSPGFKVTNGTNFPQSYPAATPDADLPHPGVEFFSGSVRPKVSLKLIPNKNNTSLVETFDYNGYRASGIIINMYKCNDDVAYVASGDKKILNLVQSATPAYSLKFADLSTQDELNQVVTGTSELTVQWQLPNPATFSAGCYVIEVEGKDTQNNDFVAYDRNNSPGGSFVIKFEAAGNHLMIRPGAPSGFVKEAFHVIANVSSGQPVTKVCYKFDGAAGEGDTELPYSSGTEWKTAATVSITSLSEGEHKVHFWAKNSTNQTANAEITFIKDTTAPIADLKYPPPNAEQAGIVRIMGSVDDAHAGVNKDGTKYIIGKQASVPTPATTGWRVMDKTTPVSWEFTYNLDDFSSNPASHGTEVSGNPGVYDIPVYILTEDNIGNKAVKQSTVRYDSAGDKPVVTVLSPQQNQTLGGTVQIFGTAAARLGLPTDIGEVYIQFSKNGNFNDTANGNMTFGTSGGGYDADWHKGGDGQLVPGTDGPNGGSNWQISINGNEAFNNPSGQNWNVYFRVRAKNKTTNKYGPWSEPVKIFIDKAYPTIGSPDPLKLVNKSDGSNPINYASGMWITDGKKLIGSLYDDSGIKTVEISSPELLGNQKYNLSQALSQGWIAEDTAHAPAAPGAKNYKLQIPLDLNTLSDASKRKGEISIKIEIVDMGQNLSREETVKLNFDITAPTGDVGEFIYRYSGNVRVSSITDSNLAQKVKEYAPGPTPDYSKLHLLINDKIRTVTNVSGTTVSFAPNLDRAGTYNCLLYKAPYIIRNDGGNWIVRGVAHDDGSGIKKIEATVTVDGMSESSGEITGNKITKHLGGQVSWEGEINLSTLKDGKGKLSCKIYDEQDNVYTVPDIDVVVKNKPIVVSKVTLMTDIAGSPESFENNTTNKALKNVKTDSNLDFTADFASTEFAFKNKNNSKIKVDFTGGYGTVKYQLKKEDGTLLGGLTAITSGGEIDLKDHFGTATDKINNSNGTPTKIILELWGETAGYTQGTNSASAKINITTLFDALDGKPPTVVILPFHWNGEADNSLYENKRANGHVEIAKINSLGNNHSSVSGKVTLRGFAYDNVKIDSIKAEIAGKTLTATLSGNGPWTAGTITSADGIVLKVKKLGADYLGYYVTWQIDWDTEKAGVGLAKDIKVTANDGTTTFSDTGVTTAKTTGVTRTEKRSAENAVFANKKPGQFVVFTKGETQYLTRIRSVTGNTATLEDDVPVEATTVSMYAYTANEPKTTVNVVPYISGITTALSELGSNEPDLYARTALGRYPVKDGETIKVHGFNLTGAACTVGGVSCGTLSADGSSWTLTLPKFVSATNKGAVSGKLEVNVGSIAAINNTNNNDKPYNKGAKTASNDKLTDDVELDVWQFNSEAVKSKDGSVAYPMMKIHPDAENNGRIGFAFANGTGWFSMASNSTSYTIFQMNWDLYQNVGFAYGPDGKSYGIASGTDVNTDNNPDTCGLATFFEVNPNGSYNNANANYNGVGGVAFESIGLGDGNINKNRIQSPAIAAGQNVYIAYYDLLKKQLRFRTKNKIVNIPGTLKNPKDSNASNYQIVVSGSSTPFVALGVVSEFDTAGTATSDKAVVLAYYDGAPRKLKLKYKTALDVTTAWTDNDSVNFSGGQDVQLAVDRSGGIHLAYTTSSGDLAYAYSASYSGTFTEYIVDSYSLTGSRLTIDVANDINGKPIPYIGYFMQGGGVPKLAYLKDGAVLEAGAKNDYYTGNWEVSVVPTPKAYDTYAAGNKVNVGVWKKKTDGKLTEGKTGSSSSGTENGNVYGNGTSNPVLGYVIEEGTIETAQKK
ncbi:hypothetical protein [Treponema sp. OMZ 857]|uniref:hypothetical protein n=1 Tax=Treponema sp. OMZ 857 TaxID=1643513 RepID=UPI0020A527B9|nr:hypothetical protein [Treponema sp. OMZ 857]